MPGKTSTSPEARPCPVCGACDALERWRKSGLRVVRCGQCAMHFADPIRADLEAGNFYDERGEGYYLSPAKLESDYAPVRFERELAVFRHYCPSGEVLDVGCSTGAFLWQLQTRWPAQYRGLGLDVVTAAIEHAQQRGVSAVRARFGDHHFGDARFDAVTFWAVLEHLSDPRAALLKAASLLRPGGYCFVLVPNLHSLTMRLLGPRYRYVTLEHLNYFSSRTLRILVASLAEWEWVEMRATHFNPIVLWQDFWRAGAPVAEAERAALLRRTTAWKQDRRGWRAFYRAGERCLAALNLADNLLAVLRRRETE